MTERPSDNGQQNLLWAIIEEVSSELLLSPLLNLIVRRACELVGADRGVIGLVDAERGVMRIEVAHQMPDTLVGMEVDAGAGLVEGGLIMPLRVRDELIGYFEIGAMLPRRFSEQDHEALTVLARHAGIAVQNARLFAAERQRATRITAINQIGHLIAGSLSLEQTIQTTLDALCRYLSLPNVALLLVDPQDADSLVLAASSGVYARATPPGYRQRISDGIIGAAARSRQHILIADVRRDPRYLRLLENADLIRSELAVPIVVGNRLLGVLNIETEQPIDEADAAGVQIVADQLAVALENARLFADIQHALVERHLLYETSQSMSVAMDVDQVVEAYLQAVATGGRYRCSVVMYEMDANGERTAVVMRGQWSPDQGVITGIQRRYPYMRDALDPLLDRGETVTIANVDTDPRVTPELRDIQRSEGRPALAMIPLIVRRVRIGLVILSYPQVHDWAVDELHGFQVTAVQLAAAIDSRQQRELLYERGQQLAVLRERQRLARDLHDSVTQLMFSITLIAESVGAAWKRNPAEGEARVTRLLELSQTAQAEMRSLLAELRASEPEQPSETPSRTFELAKVHREGLPAALKAYASTHADEALQIEVDTHQYPLGATPRTYEEAMYRIAQEALSNAIRHSGARHIEIKLGAMDDELYLIVADDGRGFVLGDAVPSANGASGLGLHTMRDRATALNGTLEISTQPERGTTIHVRLPRVTGE